RLVAAEQGERVRALVLGNTEIPGHRPFLLRLIIALGNLPGGMALLSPLFRSATLRRTRLSLGGCFADPRFVDGAFSELQIAPLFRSKRAYAGQAGLVYDWDWDVLDTLPDVHARIKAKTRFIWGAADHVWFPADKAARMVDQLPAGADFVEIPRGRLFAHEEFASDFVRLARPFLRDAFADRAGAYEPREALLA
ncbi:MAG: alpha/beta hydrolase, partial [Myxococcales bacterium]|nr:alpha/beta hydrolase [Myxococcales bacterium]